MNTSTATIWPVWSGSVTVADRPTLLSKKNAQQIWFRARKWDQRTRSPRKHGGTIGRSALAVLYSLLHDFLNFKTGRLDPAVKTIARKAGLSPRAVHTAINKLRALGLLAWQRRCEKSRDREGRFILSQLSNAYTVLSRPDLADLAGELSETLAAIEIGRPVPIDTTLEAAAKAAATGNTAEAVKHLATDDRDPLALALAGLYRAMNQS